MGASESISSSEFIESEEIEEPQPAEVERRDLVSDANALLQSANCKMKRRTDIDTEQETLTHIDDVIQEVQAIYTKFVPSEIQTAPEGREGTDAQFIKKLVSSPKNFLD